MCFESWYSELRTCLEGSPVLNLTYEDHIVPTPSNAYRKTCEFAGVDAQSASIRTGLVNPFPLKEIITNFEEVEGHLGGSRFEWMLVE